MGKYLRHVPRIKQLRGTWLHRAFGDRLFDPHLWQWERRGTALGLAIGAFFSVLPFPLQSIPAAIVAACFRSNVPAALAGCWITNPLTFPIFFYLQLKIGSFLLGRPSLMDQFQSLMDKLSWRFWEFLLEAPGVWGVLGIGGIVLGVALGVICYFAILLWFDVAIRAIQRSRARRHPARR